MRRFNDPAVLLFVASLAGSLAVHLPTYVSLGWLAEYFAERAAEAGEREDRPVETAVAYFELPPLEEPSPIEEEKPEKERPQKDEPEPEKPKPETPERAPQPEPEKPKPEPAPAEPVPAPKPPPPPPAEAEHAVIQKSQDPDVEPPPDARFVADENNRVEDETVAAVTNTVRDDERTAQQASPESRLDGVGADMKDELGGVRDREGDELRPPVEATAPSRPEAAPSRTEERARGDVRERAGDVVVDDGFGTFVVRRGPSRDGEAGEGGRGERRRRVDLKLGYAQFEGVVGADVLASEREQFAAERRSRRVGRSHAEDFQEFRSAIENFVSNVKVGNQTALNARRSPFAAYIQRVHLRFHEAFHELVAGLPGDAAHNDQNLVTRLEIVLEADGTLAAVGVVRSSGQILFDYAAYAAVKRGAPYPVAPAEIKSSDGRIYLQWDFKRDPMACHQLHARPFILEGLPAPTRGRDVIPASTSPRGARFVPGSP